MFKKILKHEYFNVVAASICASLIILLTSGVVLFYYYDGGNKPISIPTLERTTSEGPTSPSTPTTEKNSAATTPRIEEISKLPTEETPTATIITPIIEKTSTKTVTTPTTEEILKSTTSAIIPEPLELKPTTNKYLEQNNRAPVPLRTCKHSTDCHQNEVCNDKKQCVCDYGYKLDSKGHCMENNECDCLEGAYSDNSTCEAKKTVNFLLIVKDVSAEREKPSTDPDWLHYPRTYISAENDCNNEEVYLIKRNGVSEITKMSYNGGNARTFLSLSGKPEELSLDWISNKIYWIESEEKRISVVNLNDTENIKTLIDEEINNPRDIVVHPGEGKIFWTDWSEEYGGRLMWANENGSDVGTFYKGDHVQYPNALAINWEKNDLCWSDVKTLSISCVDIFNTTNIQTLVTNISDPFDLGIISDRFYFTNRLEKKIWQINGEERRVLMSTPEDGDEYLYGFVSVPPKCPELKSNRT